MDPVIPARPLGERDRPDSPLRTGRLSPATIVVALLSAAAGALHFAVSPEHFAEWMPFGIAFACLAWFQVLWAGAFLARPGRSLSLPAVAINAAVVVVWVWSRTIGLPVGPEPGSVEPVGFADSLSSAFEALLVVGLLIPPGPPASPRASASRGRMVLVLVAAVILTATIVALATLAPGAGSMG